VGATRRPTPSSPWPAWWLNRSPWLGFRTGKGDEAGRLITNGWVRDRGRRKRVQERWPCSRPDKQPMLQPKTRPMLQPKRRPMFHPKYASHVIANYSNKL
jgi:hypothetical protein